MSDERSEEANERIRRAIDDAWSRSCPPHRSPDGMPDEVIAWRCTRCGEVVRE